MKRFWGTAVLIAIATVSGFGQQPVFSAVRSHMLVSTQCLAKNLKDPKLILIHIGQERKNYDSEHIVGARFLDYDEIVATRNGVLNELPPVEQLERSFSQLGVRDDSRVILLCDLHAMTQAVMEYAMY